MYQFVTVGDSRGLDNKRRVQRTQVHMGGDDQQQPGQWTYRDHLHFTSKEIQLGVVRHDQLWATVRHAALCYDGKWLEYVLSLD